MAALRPLQRSRPARTRPHRPSANSRGIKALSPACAKWYRTNSLAHPNMTRPTAINRERAEIDRVAHRPIKLAISRVRRHPIKMASSRTTRRKGLRPHTPSRARTAAPRKVKQRVAASRRPRPLPLATARSSRRPVNSPRIKAPRPACVKWFRTSWPARRNVARPWPAVQQPGAGPPAKNGQQGGGQPAQREWFGL